MDYEAPARTAIGHVHLTVSDLGRAEAFYCGLLGLRVRQRWGDALFVAAGGYHHHIALNTWSGAGASPPPRGRTGLYHLAVLYPSRRSLARVVQRVLDGGWPLEGAADHGVSEAVYLRDPDGNGVELCRDRPRAEWPRAKGEAVMTARRLDLGELLEAARLRGDALDGEEVRQALQGLPHFSGDEDALAAEIAFPDYAGAAAFVAKVAEAAEAAHHHPDVELGYRRVALRLRSHDVDGVGRRDVALARRVEAMLAAAGGA